ncbi:hypothetical protein M405DRAFT_864509 [Rhizopogon salebrosus TDB-379]|nr:hypothetical protein M405DRAFT_864509 [Rhizopogon salebrosus TDB-379]
MATSDCRQVAMNSTTSGLAEDLAKAHDAYGVRGGLILSVVQPNERPGSTTAGCNMNYSRSTSAIFYTIIKLTFLDRHEVHVTRQTLAKLTFSAPICPSIQALKITLPSASSLTHRPITYEISDFPASSYYNTRFLLEHSCANKRPSLLLQLEGGTKVQEALTPPGMFEHFMGNESAIWGADGIDLTAYATYIRGTRMGMWALDCEDGDIVASLDNLQSD